MTSTSPVGIELVSHPLCPYVQRAAIVLAEKNLSFRRTMIDLSAKPEWFTRISPLGKVPLLRSRQHVLFESAAICDYLDEVYAPKLHPEDPAERARHRAWIAVASNMLDAISRLYNAPDESAFDVQLSALEAGFQRLNEAVGPGPFFAGRAFSIVDAAFAPVFRYFEVLDRHLSLAVFARAERVVAWRQALAGRDSVIGAVDTDYPQRLERFLAARPSYLASLIRTPN